MGIDAGTRAVRGEAAAVLDEPEKWAVLLMFDGEVLGTLHELYPSEPAGRAPAAELRQRYPLHEIRMVRRTVVWTDEGRAES
jgi:hypothetical protein